MIKLHEIHKVYTQGKKGYHALKDVTLYFEKGETIAIYGPSGCGKTTLLNILGGLDAPTTGHMVIGDKLTTQFNEKEWDHFRNYRIGFIFQSYNLIEHLPIVENVALSVKLSGEKPALAKEKAVELLTRVGLENHLSKLPGQLSGGERQRVAIARALITDPDIILADEPTGALDMKTGQEIMELIKEVSKDKLVIMVTHNKKVAKEYSTRMIELRDGRVVSDTDPKDKKVKVVKERQRGRGKLSFKEAIKLAYYNIKGKKWRTFLVSFGLSVGIVGLILIDAFFSSIRMGLSQQEQVIKDNPDLYIETPYDTGETVDYFETQLKEFGYFKEVLYAPTGYVSIGRNATDDTDLANPISLDALGVPQSQEILNTFTDYIGDGRLPLNDNEFALPLGQAQKLVSENSYLTDEEIWELVKNNEYVIYTEFDYTPNYYSLYEAVLEEKCVVTRLHVEDENGLIYEPAGWDDSILGSFGENIMELRNYTDSFIQISEQEEIYCNNYEDLEWEIDPSSPKGEGQVMTLVGIYDNNLIFEAIFTQDYVKEIPMRDGIKNDEGETQEVYRFRAFIDSDHIDDKLAITKDVENEGFWVYDNFRTGMDFFEGIINFFMYVLQFIFSSIIWIAIITGALMLLLILYISVLERKREIGIIRALGGTRNDVRTIYSGETTIIGLIAGVISVVLSVIIVLILNWYLYNYQLDLIVRYLPFIDPTKVLVINFVKLGIAILGSIFIAFISGLIPSHIASRKKPIDALRND